MVLCGVVCVDTVEGDAGWCVLSCVVEETV